MMTLHFLNDGINTKIENYVMIASFKSETMGKLNILRKESSAVYFGDSQFRRNMNFNFMISEIYVDKRLRVR